MSNRFFNFVNQFVNGAVVKSAEVNTNFAAVETAMAAVELELNRAIKFPSAESATNQVITPNAASRIGYILGYDAAGALVSTNKFLIDWDVNSKRMRNLVAAIASDEPVTLGQLAAYSADLEGIPTITGQDGPLTTDGATVSWGARATTLLPTAPSDEGGYPVYAGGAWSAVISRPNLLIDPNGAGGLGQSTDYALVPSATPRPPFWHSQTVLSSVVNEYGRYWTNAGSMSAYTGSHRTNAQGYIPVSSGATVTVSATVSTNASAGTVGFLIYTYNSGGSAVNNYASSSFALGLTRRRVSWTQAVVGDYVQVRIGFGGVTASAGGIVVQDLKVEVGSTATPFSNQATTDWLTKPRIQYNFGVGQTTPIITLGDASSTTATYDFRSAAGTQAYDARIRSSGGTNGTVGKATLAITSKSLTNTGPIGYPSEYDAGNAGSAITIDFLNGPKQKVTLNAATPAITISTTGLVVGHYQLKVVQDPASARVASWVGFAAGDCAGNAVPVITTTLSGVTFVYLYWDGTQFWVTYADWD